MLHDLNYQPDLDTSETGKDLVVIIAICNVNVRSFGMSGVLAGQLILLP